MSSLWIAAFVLISVAILAMGFTLRPIKVAVVGLALAFVLILVSTIALRRTIEFLLVPLTGAYLIAAFRSSKVDAWVVLTGSFAPLLNLVAVLSASLLPAAAVFVLGMALAWSGKRWPGKWVTFGSIAPTLASVAMLLHSP